MSIANPQDFKSRAWEWDLIDWRGFRIQQTQNWKYRQKIIDRLYRGEWAEVFPNEAVMTENPHVMNMIQTGMEDIAKLVSESTPSVLYPPVKETQTATEDAHVREAIANTHWSVNHGDLLIPRLAMDLAGSGVIFVCAYKDTGADFPCYHRIDPRFAYPDVQNNKLLDLMVLEDLNVRTAARIFPDLGLDKDPTLINKMVEIMHYYSADECIQAVLIKPDVAGKIDNMYVTRRWKPRDKDGNPYLPVAFAQLDSYDGRFQGMFDQIAGSLMTKNRIVKQMLDYADQVIYSPLEETGVLNPEAVPGPGTVYHLDPTVNGAGMRRIPPAASAPELFNILDYLDREQRGGITYPAARQGEVSQSIASASFVASTQGALTSSVRNIQRLIASAREQLNEISFKIDEAELDFKKDLLYPIGKQNWYIPTKAIAGCYRNRVVYGAGAGLDRMQADVRVMQHVGNGLVSKQTAREQIDYVSDPTAEQARIELEQSEAILGQKLLSTEDPTAILQTIVLQSQGMTFVQAASKVLAEQAQQQQAPAAPEQPGAPQTAAQQQEALAAGATAPPPVAAPPTFNPPPLEQIQVAPPRGGRTVNLGQ